MVGADATSPKRERGKLQSLPRSRFGLVGACSSLRRLAACFLLISPWCAVAAPPQRVSTPIEVPIVGRPLSFSEAVGSRFDVSMRVSRAELYQGQQLTLTVRVQAVGKYWQPPERLALKELPRFPERFKIGASPSSKPDRILADQGAWEFDYRLEPLSEKVQYVPPLPFVYYRPNRDPKAKGFFFTTYADDEIKLKVKPLPPTQGPPPKPIDAPAAFFAQAGGPEVLRRVELFALPAWPLLALLLAVPPLLAVAWSVLWKRWYPDAARLARLRQSRAAVEALAALRSLRSTEPGPVAAVVVHYLRDRFGLGTAEPTPGEVADCLRRFGLPADDAVAFFRACDEVRFAPLGAVGLTPAERVQQAQALIAALEAPPCTPQS